jgi:hypothetical protein
MASAAAPAIAVADEPKPMRVQFIATICTGSFLLFLVQPMIARMALPRLGGAPAVWNSAMLVYQALLLAGYSYAHWLGRLAPRTQAAVHLAAFALAALTLPIGLISAIPPPSANPFLWVPWLLLVSIGPLFFVVSAQAPLIQRWFSIGGGADPYPLYAASNLGSFAGLVSYPLIVEPLMPLAEQRWLWSGGFCVLALLVGWCALLLPQSELQPAAADAPAQFPPARTLAKWAILAAVPSGLVLSTTLHLTTDIVAMPLLWVLPLAAYLLSFTVAFAARRGAANAIGRLAPIVLLIASCRLFLQVGPLAFFFAGFAIFNLFTVSVALHSQLYESRPEPRQLTLFYLVMSAGGALGGLFCAVVAPLIFNWTYEHLLLLVLAAALLVTASPFARIAELWNGDALSRRLTLIGVPLVVALGGASKVLAGAPGSKLILYVILAIGVVAVGNARLLAATVVALMLYGGAWAQLMQSLTPGRMTRSFFGVYAVSTEAGTRTLTHGTTIHGVQNLGSPARQRMPTSYYATGSGVGLALAAAPVVFGDHARIGVDGLGAGTLACYARPGQSWTFYEIDPAVEEIATDPSRFTFLSRCLPNAQIRIGDARLTLEHAPPGSADILVVDAFSSDSIPMHLLTRQAFDVYARNLTPDGLLLVHISNRYLDLEPVIAAAAAAGGWAAAVREYEPSQAGLRQNESPSKWIALSHDGATLGRTIRLSHQQWRGLRRRPGFAPWTDDYGSLLPLIRWHGGPAR